MAKAKNCTCEDTCACEDTCTCGHEITVKIEGKTWMDAQEKAFQKVNKDVKIDGFRQGKAPRNIYEKKYGKQSILMEAIDIVLPKAYQNALEGKDLEIVARPSVDIKELQDDFVEFIFHVTLKPEVKIKNYKKLNVKKEKVEVSKEEIAHEIEHMRKHFSEITLKEGAIEQGDIAIIDFKGLKDDQPFEGGSGENYSLEIGSNTFIPGFEEGLISMKKGEEKDLPLTFPKEYPHEELKGKDVVFHVKVNEVKTKLVPEVNEEFFQDLSIEGVTDQASLEKFIKEDLTARKEYEIENKYIDSLLEALVKETEVEVPEAMIQEEVDRILNQFAEQMKMQGIDMNYYYQLTNTTEDALKEQMRGEAEKRVISRLALEEVAKQEKLDISDEDASKEAEVMAQRYQMEKEEFLKAFGGLEIVKYDMKMRKAIEILKESK